MEFPRDEDNQIFAEFTNRIGKIVRQYEDLEIPEGKKFEVTLYIIALQSLLTQCMELYKKLADKEKMVLDSLVTAPPGLWGIHQDLIKENTFGEEPFTYFKLFVHIRDALSHPTDQLESSSTGYTTTENVPSEKIEAFRFVHSPPNNQKVFIIEISVQIIRDLALGLSDFLAKADAN